jgi:hypothetical protein
VVFTLFMLVPHGVVRSLANEPLSLGLGGKDESSAGDQDGLDDDLQGGAGGQVTGDAEAGKGGIDDEFFCSSKGGAAAAGMDGPKVAFGVRAAGMQSMLVVRNRFAAPVYATLAALL